MNELREFTRYSLNRVNLGSAYVEIEGTDGLSGIIADLSPGGFSFIIDIQDKTDNEFDLEKFFFIKIKLDSLIIHAEVEKRWSIIKNADNKQLYNAGVSFKVISNEDRLRLNEIIEYIRSGAPEYQSRINR